MCSCKLLVGSVGVFVLIPVQYTCNHEMKSIAVGKVKRTCRIVLLMFRGVLEGR